MAKNYRSLVHVALRARCYDTMYDFYVNQLGGEEIFHLNHDCLPDGKGDESIWLTYIRFGNDQYIEMFTDGYEGENTTGAASFRSLCLEVGNIGLALKNFETLGIPICDAPGGKRVYPPFSGLEPDDSGALSAYIQDPEGNWIEILQCLPNSMQIVCV